VPLLVLRDGKKTSINVTVGELNLEAEAGTVSSAEESVEETVGFGVTLDDITPDIARRLELPRATSGALVTDIDPAGSAAQGGLRRFDVITRINGQAVTSAADARKTLQAIASGRLARVLVIRQGEELGFAIRKE
jgi:serine protease Do